MAYRKWDIEAQVWEEGFAFREVVSILNGLGVLDRFFGGTDEAPFEVLTIFRFDTGRNLWRMVSTDTGCGIPVIAEGSFQGAVVTFSHREVRSEQTVQVQHEWDRSILRRPRYRRMVTTDNGRNWLPENNNADVSGDLKFYLHPLT